VSSESTTGPATTLERTTLPPSPLGLSACCGLHGRHGRASDRRWCGDESGFACPSWPGCFRTSIAPNGLQSTIEITHRVIAFVLAGVPGARRGQRAPTHRSTAALVPGGSPRPRDRVGAVGMIGRALSLPLVLASWTWVVRWWRSASSRTPAVRLDCPDAAPASAPGRGQRPVVIVMHCSASWSPAPVFRPLLGWPVWRRGRLDLHSGAAGRTDRGRRGRGRFCWRGRSSRPGADPCCAYRRAARRYVARGARHGPAIGRPVPPAAKRATSASPRSTRCSPDSSLQIAMLARTGRKTAPGAARDERIDPGDRRAALTACARPHLSRRRRCRPGTCRPSR